MLTVGVPAGPPPPTRSATGPAPSRTSPNPGDAPSPTNDHVERAPPRSNEAAVIACAPVPVSAIVLCPVPPIAPTASLVPAAFPYSSRVPACRVIGAVSESRLALLDTWLSSRRVVPNAVTLLVAVRAPAAPLRLRLPRRRTVGPVYVFAPPRYSVVTAKVELPITTPS